MLNDFHNNRGSEWQPLDGAQCSKWLHQQSFGEVFANLVARVALCLFIVCLDVCACASSDGTGVPSSLTFG